MTEVISNVQMSISGTRCRIIIVPVPLLFLGRLNFQKRLYIFAHTILKEIYLPGIYQPVDLKLPSPYLRSKLDQT